MMIEVVVIVAGRRYSSIIDARSMLLVPLWMLCGIVEHGSIIISAFIDTDINIR